ncbi:MAG: uroporphyrinogen-III synthase [Polaromonas sp.]|nr:uroporphyrinogen-III synthase [Polaromonas sp.]
MPGAGVTTAGASAHVIVTRPARDAQRWVQQLQQNGFSAEAFPLIEIAPADDPADVQALARAWQRLSDYAAYLFVSGNAVTYFFKGKEALDQQLWAQAAINSIADKSPGLRCMAPGPGTVAALRAVGVPAGQIDAPAADAQQFDSEALWDTVGRRDWRGRRVLIVRGASAASDAGAAAPSAGRDWIAQQWRAAGAQVDFVGVYQRRAPALTQAQAERARAAGADGSVWLFSSSEAVANLASLPSLAGTDWSGARAVATHPRIVDAVRAAGWGVVVASRPALQDISATLRSIESLYP